MKVEIRKIGMNGYGIGYADSRTIFVPYTLVGDIVEVELTHLRKDIAFGRVVHYYARSKDYIEPVCEAFGPEQRCGGCDWLNCTYEQQIAYKTELLMQAFHKLKPGSPKDDHSAESSSSLDCLVQRSPRKEHYRNKVFLPVSEQDGRLVYGIFERFSHRVVPHRDCRIQNQSFDPICRKIVEICTKAGIQAYNETMQSGTLRHIGIRTNLEGNELLIILVTKAKRLPFSKLLVKELISAFPTVVGIIQNIQREPTNVILGNEEFVLWGQSYLMDRIGEMRYRIDYKSFYQVNGVVTKLLYDYVKSKLKPGSKLIDAYCGIGTIALYLSDVAQCVLGIEDNQAAVEDANFNLSLNGVTNASFIQGKVEDCLAAEDGLTDYDTIIFDPPRKGLEQSIIEQIAVSQIKEIIYVSCNPMTLARDLERFQERGFEVSSLQGFDMFPQTWHVETVATLRRNPVGT